MDINDRLLSAWREAESDLALVDSPTKHGTYVLVPGFGSPSGMLLTADGRGIDYDRLSQAASAIGAGSSVLSNTYLTYNRQDYIDMLDDWGWLGEGAAPVWYTGAPWTP